MPASSSPSFCRAFAAFIAAVHLVVSASPALCYWGREGTLVDIELGAQEHSRGVPDGHGGLIVTWNAEGGGPLRAQRLDSLGVHQWSPSGALISAARGTDPAAPLPDGTGGCFVAYQSFASKDSLYVQRLSSTGQRLWGLWGPLIATGGTSFSLSGIRVAADDAGGFYVGWQSSTSGDVDIKLQRVTSAGTIAPGWPAGGVTVAGGPARQDFHGMVDDGAGGVYVLWGEGPPTSELRDVRMLRIAPDGAPAAGWPAIGIAVVEGGPADNTFGMDLVRVGDDAVAYISKYVGSQRALVIQRMAPDGFRVWGSWGVQYVGAIHAYAEDLEPDGEGGVFASYRWSGGLIPIGLSVHRLNAAGLLQWGPDGVEVGFSTLDDFGSRLVQDGAGGVFVLWADVSQGRYDLRVQHLNAAGTTQWPQAGVFVGGQGYPWSSYNYDLLRAPTGGVHVVWTTVDGDFNNDRPDIRAQRILENGELGYALFAAPSSLTASDLPGDEGGFVRLVVGAAASDRPDWDPYVTGYSVWRRIPEGASAARDQAVLSLVEAIAAGFPPGSWESIGLHGADGHATYTFVAPTRADSSAEGFATEDFVVQTQLSVPGVTRVSEVASAHSVDNLAPATPDPFEGAYAQVVTLSWASSLENDLLGYRLYRGLDRDFPLDPAHRIYSGTATQFVDTDGTEASYYKLTAVDRHGNESRPGLVLPPGVAGVEPGAVALSLAVLGEMPSCSGVVDLEITRPGGADLTVEVLDLSGRCVERQHFSVNENSRRCTIGREASLRSGVYFVRVRSRLESAQKRVLVTR